MIFFNAILATIALGFNFTTLKSPSLQQDVVEIRFNIWDSLSKIIMAKEAIFDFLSISSCRYDTNFSYRIKLVLYNVIWYSTILFGLNLYLSDLN